MALWVMPPPQGFSQAIFSSKRNTRRPARANLAAASEPAGPAPITAIVECSIGKRANLTSVLRLLLRNDKWKPAMFEVVVARHLHSPSCFPVCTVRTAAHSHVLSGLMPRQYEQKPVCTTVNPTGADAPRKNTYCYATIPLILFGLSWTSVGCVFPARANLSQASFCDLTGVHDLFGVDQSIYIWDKLSPEFFKLGGVRLPPLD